MDLNTRPDYGRVQVRSGLIQVLFRSPKQTTERRLQPDRQPPDCPNRRVSNATLDPADVGTIQSAFESEFFLREALSQAKLPQSSAEGSEPKPPI